MHLAGCLRFWLWALAGALVTFSLVAAASVGLFVLPLSALVTVLAARSTRFGLESLGGLVGAGAIFILIAWLQRPPGGFDWQPWLLAGALLAAVGIAGYAVLGRRFAPPA